MPLKLFACAALRYPILTRVLLITSILLAALPAWARPAVLTASLATSPINVRVSPSSQSSLVYSGYAGDRVDVLKQTQAADGHTWDYVTFDHFGAKGWVRSDLVSPIASAPSSSPVKSPVVLGPPEPTGVISNPPSVQRPQQEVTSEQISYFLEIALGAEFSQAGGVPVIHKWQGDVTIQPLGSPTPEDLTTLKSVISEVNDLTKGEIHLQLVDHNPTITIHFSPESQFSQIEPNYRSGNYGYFWTQWDEHNQIRSANILITTTKVTQKERSHLIREELTQSLGLMKDSFKYADSVFYQPWTSVTQYSAIDRSLIKLLYDPQISPGMTQAQVKNVLTIRQAHY